MDAFSHLHKGAKHMRALFQFCPISVLFMQGALKSRGVHIASLPPSIPPHLNWNFVLPLSVAFTNTHARWLSDAPVPFQVMQATSIFCLFYTRPSTPSPTQSHFHIASQLKSLPSSIDNVHNQMQVMNVWRSGSVPFRFVPFSPSMASCECVDASLWRRMHGSSGYTARCAEMCTECITQPGKAQRV